MQRWPAVGVERDAGRRTVVLAVVFGGLLFVATSALPNVGLFDEAKRA